MDFNFATANLLAHLIEHQAAVGKAAWLDQPFSFLKYL